MIKAKNYTESQETLEWLTEHIPKQKESAFIRYCNRKEIKRLGKLSTENKQRTLQKIIDLLK